MGGPGLRGRRPDVRFYGMPHPGPRNGPSAIQRTDEREEDLIHDRRDLVLVQRRRSDEPVVPEQVEGDRAHAGVSRSGSASPRATACGARPTRIG